MGADPQRSADDYWLGPGGGFARYPGPALVLRADGGAEALNEAGGPLCPLFEGGAEGLEALRARLATGEPAGPLSVAVPGDDGEQVFEVAVLPAPAPLLAVLLCRDVTFERNLRQALTDSRGRYKDLVEVSSDFAWETNAEGEFVFVSPRGTLGYAAGQLVGRRAADFVLDFADDPAPSPFEATARRDAVELWFRRADGTPACLVAACAPVLDETGVRRGARGVCRDVTEDRERDTALAAARNRERLNAYIANAIRNEVMPADMLAAAAAAVARALSAATVQIHRRRGTPRLVPAAEHGPAVPVDDLEGALARAAEEEGPVTATAGGRPALVMATRFQRAVNGVVCVVRGPDAAEWSDDDRQALRFAADQAALVIEQAAHQETLHRLSRTDALTGLVNRRAFFEEVAARLDLARRRGRPGSLMYVDLDNFKQVNDTHGHERGDAALRAVAALLLDNIRSGDVAARLGGDEFALWLDGAGREGGERMARALLARTGELRAVSAGDDAPLGFSIGIAVFEPGGDDAIDALVARADQAMYAAKRAGKGTYRLCGEKAETAA